MDNEVFERVEDAGRAGVRILIIIFVATALLWITRILVNKYIENSKASALLADRMGDYATRIQTLGKVIHRVVEGIIVLFATRRYLANLASIPLGWKCGRRHSDWHKVRCS